MISSKLYFHCISISLSLFGLLIFINIENISAKSFNISEDDTLKTQLETKILELKKAVKEINNLLETDSPKEISPESVDNWYKQSAWLMDSRNIIEEYFIYLNRFIDYWEHNHSNLQSKKFIKGN